MKRTIALIVFLTLLALTFGPHGAAPATAASGTVLLLGDGSSETAIIPFLTSAGFNVISGPLETAYDGTNPSLTGIDVVMLLDGNTYNTDMPLSGQTTLHDFVTTDGCGLVLTEWFAYERLNGRYVNLADLQLLARDMGHTYSDTYTVVDASHPVTAGLPPTFAVPTAGMNVGTVINGGTVLITGTLSLDAVAVKEFSPGRVVQLATATGYAGYNPWNTEMQTLLINSLQWAAENCLAPSAFNKISPANTSTLPSNLTTLSWSDSSGQTDYEYCIDPNINSTCDSGGVWTSTTNTTSVSLPALAVNNQYEWQVHAVNGGTVEADGGVWWTFTTGPDITDPVVTVPADMTAESTDFGAFVSFSASATDETAPPSPAVTCVPASGSFFTLGGPHLVTCSATDTAGNTGSASFNITVVDTTPPIWSVPADMTVEATGPSGAVVGYGWGVSDNGSGLGSVYGCVPSGGSTFPFGTTHVTCTATDNAGNTGYGYFNITVVDTTPPTLSLPADITVPQTIPAGAVVSYNVTASDAVDASPTVVCAPPSGSTFPVGTTTVNCSATDDYSNTSNGSFTVTVTAGANLLKKPDFASASVFPFPWKAFGFRPPYAAALDCQYYLSAPCSVVFPAGNRAGIQQVNRTGFAGDVYSFGMYSASQNAPIGGDYRIEVSFYTNFNKLMGRYSVYFNPLTHEFELGSGEAVATGNYNKVIFRFIYNNSSGRAWFDDAFLYFLGTAN